MAASCQEDEEEVNDQAAAKRAVTETLQPWEPSLDEQEQLAVESMGLTLHDFDGTWLEWYQKINVLYWIHRLTQAHISGRSGEKIMTEYSGCENRIDLCANGSHGGKEVAELKMLGVGGLDGAVNSAKKQLEKAKEHYGPTTRLAHQGYPLMPLVDSFILGTMTVTWRNQNLGLYTYELSGTLPTLPAWRDLKVKVDLRALEARFLEGTATDWISLGPIPGWVGPTLVVSGAVGVGIATCVISLFTSCGT